MKHLSADQQEALAKARHHFGRGWKSKLQQCWMHANYPHELEDVAPHLQRLRNTLGPSGLSNLQ